MEEAELTQRVQAETLLLRMAVVTGVFLILAPPLEMERQIQVVVEAEGVVNKVQFLLQEEPAALVLSSSKSHLRISLRSHRA